MSAGYTVFSEQNVFRGWAREGPPFTKGGLFAVRQQAAPPLDNVSLAAFNELAEQNGLPPLEAVDTAIYQEALKTWGAGEAGISTDTAQIMAENETADVFEYGEYIDIVGSENMPGTFEEFQGLKYTGGDAWDSLRAYVRGVKSNHLSVLTGLEHYRAMMKNVRGNLVGLTTSDGIEIKGASYHYIDRTIGNEGAEMSRKGVAWEDAREALLNPIFTEQGAGTEYGQSVRYYGRNCMVTVDPNTGVLIQTNPIKRR